MDTLYQAERSECGIVALAMLASAHGLRVDLSSFRARYPVSLRGSTLADLLSIAKDINLDARALRCEVHDLNELRLPAILHWNLDHFVVLAKISRGKYVIHDPATGATSLSQKELSEKFTGVALEAWPTPEFRRADRRRKLRLDSIIPRNHGIARALAIIFGFALAIEVVSLLLPILQQFVIDDALLSLDTDLLKLLTIATAVFLFGQAATVALRGLVQRNLTASLSIMVPAYVFGHMIALPSDWFERRSGADILNRLESGDSIHHTITTSIVSAGIDGIVAVVALLAMAVYSYALTGIVIGAFAFYGLVRILWYESYRRKSQGAIIEKAKLQGLIWETMRGIATIKAFNAISLRFSKYIASLSRYIRLLNGISSNNIAFGTVHDVIFAAERVAIVYVGASAVLSNGFTVGMLVSFLAFRDNFIVKGSNLINTVIQFRLLDIHLDRLSDILLANPEPKHELPFLGDRNIRGEIELRNISYRYGESEGDVLRNCSLKVEEGESVAIVGPSGMGKTTLFKILTAQLAPRSGEYLIDGRSLKSLGVEYFRSQIGVVRQDDMLFSGTIAENIAFFDDRPDYERIVDVAKKSFILEEILKMPMGFNSLIGSMGTGLSSGQCQRIMLARALYRNPRILFLDEATSHLDTENERLVSLALRELSITQVIIAHRPETIAKAERVVDIREINGPLGGARRGFRSSGRLDKESARQR
jgi:ATP-binding cassette subfamily B protein RaxB